MVYRSFYTCILLGLLSSFIAMGQNNPYAGEMKKVIAIVKETRNMSYKYHMTGEFPNGDKDLINGEVYIGNTEKLMYNSNEAFTLVYTQKWFYKADHRNKTVTIVNLKKNMSEQEKKAIEHDLFEGGTLSYYFDSVVLRYASVKKLKKNEDSVRIELVFPEPSSIKSIQLAYDEKAKILTSYRLYIFEPWHTTEYGKDKGTAETIICWDFKKARNTGEYEPEHFFAVKNNKTTLKKYNTYKLTTKI